jgi:hypothetical protein
MSQARALQSWFEVPGKRLLHDKSAHLLGRREIEVFGSVKPSHLFDDDGRRGEANGKATTAALAFAK